MSSVREYKVIRRAEVMKVRARFALRSGWPTHLTPKQVQALNVLAAVGAPVRHRKITQALGYHPHTALGLKALAGEGLVLIFGDSNASRTYTLGPVALAILEERAKWEKGSPMSEASPR